MALKNIGKYAFMAGIALAVFGVFTDPGNNGAILLGLLGLVGGFTRVSKGSETHFLVLALALHTLGPFIGTWPTPEIGENILLFLAGIDSLLAFAAIAVILRNLYHWVAG
jgi:hypothetical protein